MTPLPISLNLYFTTELVVVANKTYDEAKPLTLALNQLIWSNEVVPPKSSGGLWRIILRLRQDATPENNSPYSFRIEIVGDFQLAPNYPPEKAHAFVEANGTGMLYSTAREILRSAMAAGPYFAINLPTVVFTKPKQQPAVIAAPANSPS